MSALNSGSREVSEQRLTSWKEIAAYLRTTDRTVQRWELEGLPVHRLNVGKRPTVYAYPSELDAWIASKSESPAAASVEADEAYPPAGPEQPAPAPSRRRWLAMGSVLAAAVLALAGLTAKAPWFGRESAPVLRQWAAVGAARPLTSEPGLERTPSISPDGRFVAYSRRAPGRRDFDIYILDLATGKSRPFAASPLWELSPAWSPDGRRIAFARQTDRAPGQGQFLLVVADADGDGDGAEELAPIGAGANEFRSELLRGPFFAWTPDGRELIFGAGRRSSDQGLFVLDTDCRVTRRLTFTLGRFAGDADPAVSPDGRWLAFVRRMEPFYGELFVLDLRNPDVEPVARTRFGRLVTSPRFSPDGREILFAAGEHTAGRRLWSVPVEGDIEPRPVTGDLGQVYDFDFYADGGRLRLVYTAATTRSDLWRFDVGGGEPRRILSSAGTNDLPAISPDGQRLAFVSDRSGESDIWLSDPDGGSLRSLTTGNGPVISSLDWSPDGRRLATTARVEGARNVVIVDAETGRRVRLTDGDFADRAARWSADGSSLYFSSNRDSVTRRMFRIPAAGGAATVEGDGLAMADSLDGGTRFTIATSRQLIAESGEGRREMVSQTAEATSFDVADGWLFYLRPTAARDLASLDRLHLASGRIETLAEIRNPNIGLAADRAGRTVYYSTLESVESDLQTIDLASAAR